jgi:hypothetical protein
MIVITPASVAFPVTVIEPLPVMSRTYPVRARIRWERPIPVMPTVMVSGRVPIPIYPVVSRTGGSRPDMHDSRGRRRADPDSDRNLAEYYTACQ